MMVSVMDIPDFVHESHKITQDVLRPFADRFNLSLDDALSLIVRCDDEIVRRLAGIKTSGKPVSSVSIEKMAEQAEQDALPPADRTEAKRAAKAVKKAARRYKKRKYVTEEMFQGIRYDYALRNYTQDKCARKWGCSASACSDVLNRKGEKYKKFKDHPEITQAMVGRKLRANGSERCRKAAAARDAKRRARQQAASSKKVEAKTPAKKTGSKPKVRVKLAFKPGRRKVSSSLGATALRRKK